MWVPDAGAAVPLLGVFTKMLSTLNNYCEDIAATSSLDGVTLSFLQTNIIGQEFERCFSEIRSPHRDMKRLDGYLAVLIACLNDLRCSPRYNSLTSVQLDTLDAMMNTLDVLFHQLF